MADEDQKYIKEEINKQEGEIIEKEEREGDKLERENNEEGEISDNITSETKEMKYECKYL